MALLMAARSNDLSGQKTLKSIKVIWVTTLVWHRQRGALVQILAPAEPEQLPDRVVAVTLGEA